VAQGEGPEFKSQYSQKKKLYVERKEPFSKDYILYDTIHVIFYKDTLQRQQ
jgi:hypothetical protein